MASFFFPEFSPVPSIIRVNQRRVAPLHIHYSLMKPSISRATRIVTKQQRLPVRRVVDHVPRRVFLFYPLACVRALGEYIMNPERM